jgi:hypothetical protein
MVGMALWLLAAACGGGTAVGSQSDPIAKVLAYSKCMRAHGVPDFPDPVEGANGLVSLGGLGLTSPQAAAARQACRSLAPAGPAGPETVPGVQQKAFLLWASCIRSSGVPDFPDPSFSGDGPHFDIPADANLGTLQDALNVCQHYLTGKWPGGAPIQIKHRS